MRLRSAGAVAALAVAAAAAGGCSSEPDDAPAGQAGAAGSNASGSRWGDGDCYACVSAACSDVIALCRADSACAAWFTCLADCPTAAGGNVDATCRDACPQASGTAAQAAIDTVEHCRTQKGGAECAACGG